MIEFSLSRNIAILIDADNVNTYWEGILKFSEYYGKRSICLASGLGQSFSKRIRKDADALNIELIMVKKRPNAAEVRLALELGRILEDQDHYIDLFIIVSGDDDLLSIIDPILEEGRKIIGIANKEKTAPELQASCDEFYYAEDLEKRLNELKKEYPIPFDELREFYNQLLFAYHHFTKSYSWVDLEELEKQLGIQHPNYESQFGKYQLSEWLKSLSKYFEYDGNRLRRIYTDPKGKRRELIISAYVQTQDADGIASLRELGKPLHKHPDYKRLFGSKKLSRWIEDYADEFRIDGENVIHKNYWET